MESKEIARLAIQALEDKKAEEIKTIDISEVSVIADYFIIANGTNHSQIQALSDHVEETLGRAGVTLRQIEGYQNANWVLLDFHDVIIHIFDKENRLFYDLERIWRDVNNTALLSFQKTDPDLTLQAFSGIHHRIPDLHSYNTTQCGRTGYSRYIHRNTLCES